MCEEESQGRIRGAGFEERELAHGEAMARREAESKGMTCLLDMSITRPGTCRNFAPAPFRICSLSNTPGFVWGTVATARTIAVVVLLACPLSAALAQTGAANPEKLPWLPEQAVPAPQPAAKPAAAVPKIEKARAVEQAPDKADGKDAKPGDAKAEDEKSKDEKSKNAKSDAAAEKKKKEEPKAARLLFGAAKSAAALKPRAIGWYAKGCLAGGQKLEINGPAWQAMRLSRNRNWGHPKLIALLERFATEMKTKENWPGLLIGDLAQPRGGPMLSGHKSHQVGLDADIWFKPMPDRVIPVAERETFEPLLLAEGNGTEVIAKNWNDGFARLVKRAASYPEVERIFVHPAIKKKFCEVAGDDKAWLGKVRPMWLHNYHFHVRIGCPSGSPSCEKQTSVSGDDGCGKELTDWIKLVSKPAAPVKPSTAPAKPSKPKPEMTVAQLPSECQGVLAAGDLKQDEPAVADKPAADGSKEAAKQ